MTEIVVINKKQSIAGIMNVSLKIIEELSRGIVQNGDMYIEYKMDRCSKKCEKTVEINLR